MNIRTTTIAIATLLIACAGTACSNQTDPEPTEDEHGGTGTFQVGPANDHAATAGQLSTQSYAACSDSEWAQAQIHAIDNHSMYSLFGGPDHPVVTSCSFNSSSGYIVYTYAYR